MVLQWLDFTWQKKLSMYVCIWGTINVCNIMYVILLLALKAENTPTVKLSVSTTDTPLEKPSLAS